MNRIWNLNKKYFIYFFYIVVLLTLLFFIYKNFSITKEFEKVEKINSDIKKSILVDKMETKDSDGDGLEDWEEILYGTDLELADSDQDGISDFDEINLNRDPLIFGKGYPDEITKVFNKKENIFSIADQKKEFEKIFQEQKRKITLLQNIQEKEKVTKEDIELLESERKEKKKIKKDLNNSAEPITANLYRPGNHSYLINNLFLFFMPENKSKSIGIVKEYNKIISEDDIKDYKDFSESDIEEIGFLISSYENTSKALKNLKFEVYEVEKLISSLADSYQRLADSLKQAVEQVKKGNRKYNIGFFNNYHMALRKNVLALRNINDFLTIGNIEFSDWEAGKIFVYSL